jgi:hypothetical protein
MDNEYLMSDGYEGDDLFLITDGYGLPELLAWDYHGEETTDSSWTSLSRISGIWNNRDIGSGNWLDRRR